MRLEAANKPVVDPGNVFRFGIGVQALRLNNISSELLS